MLKTRNLFQKKKILIYGFGKTGKASFNFLKKTNIIKIYDDKISSITKSFKKYYLSKNNIYKDKFDYISISPGIDYKNCNLSHYLSLNKNKIINELDIFFLNNIKNKKITITGTNGKSTTSKLLSDIIKKNKIDVRLLGNIGKPLLSEKKITSKTMFVIEASSYQLEYSKYFKTNYSTILNISPDHLERHATFQKYVNSKFKLVSNQDFRDYAFIPKGNKVLSELIKKKGIRPKIIKVRNNIKKDFLKKIKNPYFNNINNQINLTFALEICKQLKLSKRLILKAVNSFKGLRFRQQILYNKKNLLIINDSKSTSFASSINLLKSYKNIYWILGGKYKKGDRFNLEKSYFKNIKAYIFGKKTNFFVKKLKGKIHYEIFPNVKLALLKVIKDAKNKKFDNKNILFSPSAASFDQYKNFEERGKHFEKLLKQINLINKINGS